MQVNGNNGNGKLRAELEAAMTDGYKMKDLKVIARRGADPYMIDTPAFHEAGGWLAEQRGRLFEGRVLHLRGIHYVLVAAGDVVKPNGLPYVNTEEDWVWLGETALKGARWLGYIPFDAVRDARNAEPIVRRFADPEPMTWIRVGGVEVELPDELEPTVELDGFRAVQPYRLVIIGEKTSLEDVLSPIAEQRSADLYLPSGDISDTLVYAIARDAAEDGRPLVCLYASDCDPSGWNMPITVSRKLQALRELQFPELRFQMRRVALTPGQVREYGLPSAPMKDTEKRADRWTEAMGVRQTEVDALATLRPELLDQLVRKAIKPFYDSALGDRVRQAKRDWLERAQLELEDQLGDDELDRIRTDAEAKIAGLQEQVDALNEALTVDTGDLELPDLPDIPEPEIDTDPDGPAVIDSAEGDWVEQTLWLKRQANYAY